MQPATPFPGGYVPAAGPFAMHGAVGAAQPGVTMTGPMQAGGFGTTGVTGGRRRGFHHDDGDGDAGDDDDEDDGDDGGWWR